MASRSLGRNKKKSSDREVKVAVVGAPHVGKSALAVRFLTKRYIGEYHHNEEMKYKSEMQVDGEPVQYEVLDTCSKGPEELPSPEMIQWADGIILVYSITDRKSFNHVRRIKEAIPGDLCITLMANKADMVHLRQVSYEEGEILAKDFECTFFEVTAAEQVTQIADGFMQVCKEIMAARRRTKNSLLTRVLGGRNSHRVYYSRGKSDSALPKE